MNVDKAMEIIDQIASKLGVAAEYIIPEMARMQIAKLIIGIVASIIVLAVVCVAIRKIIKYIRSLTEDDDDDSWSGDQDMIRFSLMLLAGVIGFVGLFAALALFEGISELSGWIASPTAQSIEYVMKALKSA